MATASLTESTIVVRTSPGLATASSEDASSFLAVEPSEDGPRGGSDASRAEERVARLVREMFDVCCREGASRFEAPGFATASSEDASSFLAVEPSEDGPRGGSDAGRAEERVARLVREMFDVCSQGGASRFEAPGLATASSEDASSFLAVEPSEDGPRGGSDAGRAEERVARLVREMFDVSCQEGASRFEDFLARYPGLPDLAFRLIAKEAHLRRELGEGVSAVEIERRLPRAQQVISAFPAVGETVGEFRLLASLGRGVWGAVFLADQPSLANRPVVLKITSRKSWEHLSLAKLRHAHIVPLYCVQDLADRDLRLLCMPYLGGTTLERFLSELGKIPIARRTGRDLLSRLDQDQAETPLSVPSQGPAQQFLSRASYLQAVCWIGACLADALQFAHQRELLHLDLKPSNVLLAADGTPMLLDFHLAQPPIRPNESVRRQLGGTPNYMSPEQWVAMMELHEGRPITSTVDGRSDIYALGVMLYEMLGGDPVRFLPHAPDAVPPPSPGPRGIGGHRRQVPGFRLTGPLPRRRPTGRRFAPTSGQPAASRRFQPQLDRALAEVAPAPSPCAGPGSDDRRGLLGRDPGGGARRRRRRTAAPPRGRVFAGRKPQPHGQPRLPRGSVCPESRPGPYRPVLGPVTRPSSVPIPRPPAGPETAACPGPADPVG